MVTRSAGWVLLFIPDEGAEAYRDEMTLKVKWLVSGKAQAYGFLESAIQKSWLSLHKPQK